MTQTEAPGRWVGYSYVLNGHNGTCSDSALAAVEENAITAGVWVAGEVMIAEDRIANWSATAAEIAQQWLADGTKSCRCGE